MSNSNYKVSIKRKIIAIIAAAMLAVTCAMPALAGQENTGKGEFSFPMGNFISPPIALAQTPFSEAITYAPNTQLLAMGPEVMIPGKIATDKLRDLKVVTTDLFEKNHLAKDREEALKKARDRGEGGGDLLHYMKSADLSSLPQALKRKFSKELEAEKFETPKPDFPDNNYWTGLKATVWEYDKKADKISDRTVELCLGFITPFPLINDNKTVQVGVHHIQAVR